MRVLVDTNILVSASMSKTGNPYLAFVKAVSSPYQGVVCDQNMDELRRVYNRKFPHKLELLQDFLAFALPVLEGVQTPALNVDAEERIRDVYDRPILRVAIIAIQLLVVHGV